PRPANVRVMAATNRDLEVATKAGRFREDLFYRLNVISLQLTPLRQRQLDLPKLAATYLRFFARQCGKRIDGVSTSASEAMRHYAWPGNLRELRNLMERAVILAASKRIELADLPENLNAPQEGADRARVQLGARLALEDIEREHIRLVMSRSDTLEEAAHVLAIDPATLYRKRKQWGL